MKSWLFAAGTENKRFCNLLFLPWTENCAFSLQVYISTLYSVLFLPCAENCAFSLQVYISTLYRVLFLPCAENCAFSLQVYISTLYSVLFLLRPGCFKTYYLLFLEPLPVCTPGLEIQTPNRTQLIYRVIQKSVPEPSSSGSA